MSWNPVSLAKGFETAANSAEQYAQALLLRPKMGGREKELHDEHYAKFFVYDYLASVACIDSREQLLQALRRYRAAGPISGRGMFDQLRFQAEWHRYIDYLISEYSDETDSKTVEP